MRKVNRKSIYCLSAAAVALLIGGTATAHAAYKTVTLNVDGKKQSVTGFQFGTVEELLKQQGVQVGKEDLVQPAGSNEIADGTTVVVKHAKTIQVIDGATKAVSAHTLSETVGDLLKELKIDLNSTDTVNQELTASLKEGETISITRKTKDVKVEEEAIPFQTERQPDADTYTGTENVLTPGVEGKAKITTTIFYENGKEVDRKSQREVTAEPVNQVVAYGTKQRPVVVTSRSGETMTASKSLLMAASAYSMPGERTASGAICGHGVVAVDPSVIPLGTKLYIDGYGYAVASDVGGAIKGNRIDLAFDSESEAMDFGRQTVTVHILN